LFHLASLSKISSIFALFSFPDRPLLHRVASHVHVPDRPELTHLTGKVYAHLKTVGARMKQRF
jgi:hypothetical protein